jgi:probable HAF family extracellular repeat protein
MIRMFCVMVVVSLMLGCSGYVFQGLPGLGGSSGSATDINNQGDIVGHCRTEEGVSHAVLWHTGSVVDLGTLGGDNSYALGINDDGDVVGYSETADGDMHAFVWQEGIMTDIHDPDVTFLNQSYAHDISDHGLIAGTMSIGGIVWLAPDHYVWVLEGSGFHGPSDAYDVNNSGQAVGWYHGNDQAYVWQDGSMTILPHLGVNRSRAYGINNSGQIAGSVVDPDSHLTTAAVWQADSPPQMLGTLGGNMSMARAISDTGTIVGMSKNPEDAEVPFYATLSEGVMHELMNLSSGWAANVNRHGVIVGWVVDSQGDRRPVKWVWTSWQWP